MINLVLVGPTQSGKSSIIARYKYDDFQERTYRTIGAYLNTIIKTINDDKVKFQIVK